MDGFNEKSNEEVEQQQPLGCLHRFSKTIKIVIIGGLIILLMIPMFMIEDLISERGRTQEEAINEDVYKRQVLYRWLSPSNLTCVLQRYSRELPRILQLHKPSLLPLPYLSGTV